MTSGPAWPGPITTLACPRTALLSPVCPSQLGWKGFRRAPPRPPNSLSPSRGCMDEDSSSLSKWSSTQSTEAQCSPARLSPAQPGSVSPAQSGRLWPEGVAIAQLRDSSLLLSPCGSWPARCPYALCGPRPSALGPAPALAPHAPGSSSAAGWLRAVSLLSCTSFRERTAERRAVTIRLSPHWVGA